MRGLIAHISINIKVISRRRRQDGWKEREGKREDEEEWRRRVVKEGSELGGREGKWGEEKEWKKTQNTGWKRNGHGKERTEKMTKKWKGEQNEREETKETMKDGKKWG